MAVDCVNVLFLKNYPRGEYPEFQSFFAMILSPQHSPVTRGAKMWKKCVGHSLKNLGPFKKTLCPPGVPRW